MALLLRAPARRSYPLLVCGIDRMVPRHARGGWFYAPADRDYRRRHRRNVDGKSAPPHYGDSAHITVVDHDDRHVYQPGMLFVPFGLTDPRGEGELLVRCR